MRKCSKCGAKLDKDSLYCPNCGALHEKKDKKINTQKYLEKLHLNKKKLLIIIAVVALIVVVGVVVNSMVAHTVTIDGVNYNIPAGYSEVQDESNLTLEDSDDANIKIYSNNSEMFGVKTDTTSYPYNYINLIAEGYIPNEINGVKGFSKVIVDESGNTIYCYGYVTQEKKLAVIAASNPSLIKDIISNPGLSDITQYEEQTGDVAISDTYTVHGTVKYVSDTIDPGIGNGPEFKLVSMVDENGSVTVLKLYGYDNEYLVDTAISHYQVSDDRVYNQAYMQGDYPTYGIRDGDNAYYVQIIYSDDPSHMTAEYLDSILVK